MSIYAGTTRVSGGGGVSPYQAAVTGGYQGTEDEFNALLAGIPDTEKQTTWDEKADTAEVASHTNNGDIHVSADEKASWNNKANAATTLAGYGIMDSITKAEADSTYAALGIDGKIPSALLPEISTMRIATGTYNGSSAEYSQSEITLSTGFPAKLLFLFLDGGALRLMAAQGATSSYGSFAGTRTGAVTAAGYVYALNDSDYGAMVSFSDTTIVVKCIGSGTYSLFNMSGTTYRWYAIG